MNVPQSHNVAPNYRADIDGLRAISVLAVLAFHASPNLLPGGFAGVDVFFVISGFLISTIIFSSLEAGSFSFIAFYTRRILRIFPPLILLLSACLTAGWFVLLPGELTKLAAHATYAVGSSTRFFTAKPDILTRHLKPSLCCTFGRSALKNSFTLSGHCWSFSPGAFANASGWFSCRPSLCLFA